MVGRQREGSWPLTEYRQMNDILDSLSNKASPQTQAVWVQIEAVTLKASFAFQLLIISNSNLFLPGLYPPPPQGSNCYHAFLFTSVAMCCHAGCFFHVANRVAFVCQFLHFGGENTVALRVQTSQHLKKTTSMFSQAEQQKKTHEEKKEKELKKSQCFVWRNCEYRTVCAKTPSSDS